MIAGFDSSIDRPTPAIAAAARAAGVRLWIGYLATKPDVGLLSPWDQASFEAARLVGGQPVAMCSGWDDPIAVRQLAAEWNVRPCLDCEDGIRGDGPWVQGWLDAAGAGLYGNSSVHFHTGGRRAAFNIVASYPCVPPECCAQRASWPPWLPLPDGGGPLGWQQCGTHTEFGLSVDSGVYDDWFTEDDMTPEEHGWLAAIYTTMTRSAFKDDPPSQTWLDVWAHTRDQVDAIKAAVDVLAASGIPPTDLKPITDQLTMLSSKIDTLARHTHVVPPSQTGTASGE